MPSALRASTISCDSAIFFGSAAPVSARKTGEWSRQRLTPYLARRRAMVLRASPESSWGGPFTAQNRTGCWFEEKANSSPLAAMTPCSPANRSFRKRRSMALSEKGSLAGANSNQPSSAEKAELDIASKSIDRHINEKRERPQLSPGLLRLRLEIPPSG